MGAAVASRRIVDCVVEYLSAQLWPALHSNQLSSIFIDAGLICAVATELYPVYIQRRSSLQYLTLRNVYGTFTLLGQFNT